MNRTLKWCKLGLILAALACALSSGCWQRLPENWVPPYSPSPAANEALRMFDANRDAKLSGRELDKTPALKGSLAELDKDQDSALTYDEIVLRLFQHLEVPRLFTDVAVTVTSNGQPFVNAEVNLLPEPFLEPGVKPAQGTTGSDGQCEFQIDGQDYPGVGPGFYRVTIMKTDSAGKSLVPARYNTATTLGCEIWSGGRRSFVFNVSHP